MWYTLYDWPITFRFQTSRFSPAGDQYTTQGAQYSCKKEQFHIKSKKISGTFVFLLLFVLLCAFFAQYLTGAETLQDYADNNPELAYGRSETEEPPDTELTGT